MFVQNLTNFTLDVFYVFIHNSINLRRASQRIGILSQTTFVLMSEMPISMQLNISKNVLCELFLALMIFCLMNLRQKCIIFAP